MTWLVTGGAGYIGSHVVSALRGAGIQAVVVDSLSSGHREFVPDDVPFVHGTILDSELVARTMLCLLYTSPSPRDLSTSRMPSSA